MMAARWKTLAMALALLALHGDFTTRNGVMAEADCLKDGESCASLETCPQVCCSGVGIRTSGNMRRCPQFNAVFGSAADNTPTAATSPMSVDDNSHWEAAGSDTSSSSEDNTAPSSNGGDGLATDSPSAQSNSTATTDAPTPTPSTTKSTDSVDAFQSSSSSVSRGGANGSTTFVVVIGALAGCVVLVAAVMYKRKTANQTSLDAPSSSYRGSDGAGLTPDNRSLVGMLDGGARATTDSMKQLPVLSMGSRDDASIPARISSPFGQGAARISSPANRGMTNEDYAFEVESRAGSSVQVAFVDVHHDADIAPEKNGVVAL